jgi:5-methyltetrahydrofolate--homocysteine methyltransferase
MENKNYVSFLKLMEQNKTEESVLFIVQLLKEKQNTVKEVYVNFLIPAMKYTRIKKEEGNITAWQERMYEDVLKTVMEQTFLSLLEQKAKLNGKKVLIASPDGEFEQLGALVAKYIFMLNGFTVVYLGAGLQKKEILDAIEHFKPDYYTIGLKNYYNAFETKKMLNEVAKKHPNIKIVVGGPVFKKEEVQHSLKYDYFVRDYTEIFAISKEEADEARTKDSK